MDLLITYIDVLQFRERPTFYMYLYTISYMCFRYWYEYTEKNYGKKLAATPFFG
jgi:hypothetical protein